MLNVKIVTEYSKVSVQMWLPLSRPRYHYCSILSIFFSPILSFHQHNIVVGQIVGKRTHLGISGKGKVPNNKVLLCYFALLCPFFLYVYYSRTLQEGDRSGSQFHSDLPGYL